MKESGGVLEMRHKQHGLLLALWRVCPLAGRTEFTGLDSATGRGVLTAGKSQAEGKFGCPHVREPQGMRHNCRVNIVEGSEACT